MVGEVGGVDRSDGGSMQRGSFTKARRSHMMLVNAGEVSSWGMRRVGGTEFGDGGVCQSGGSRTISQVRHDLGK